MIRLEDVHPLPGKLLSERVTETQHVRTFSESELLQLMLDAVKRQAGHVDEDILGASIRAVSPSELRPITVRVAVKENTR